MIKKVLFSLLVIGSIFLFNENVFASDLNGNNSMEVMPPFLKDYYTITVPKNACDDYTQSYCNLYTHLEQFFSEFHTLHKYVVFYTYKYPDKNTVYRYVIDFYLGEPYMSVNSLSNANIDTTMTSLSGDGLRHYQIELTSDKSVSKIRYFYGSENGSNNLYSNTTYDFRAFYENFYTNFDLYSLDNTFLKKSDVQNWSYHNLSSMSGIMLIPKHSTSFKSQFSYDKENIFINWYDKTENKLIREYLKLDKPVSDTLSYALNYTDEYISSYNFVIANFGQNSSKIGYVAEDFEIVQFNDLTTGAYDSTGKYYDNPLTDLYDRVSSDNGITGVNWFQQMFNSITSIPKKIIDGITSLFQWLLDGIIEGLKLLFIPSDEYLKNWFDDMQKSIEEQLGFLSYPITWILNILNRFLTLNDTGHYLISWGAIKVPNFDFNIIESGSFDLSTLLENSTINSLHSLYITVVNALMLLGFMNLCMNTYNRIFGGDIDTYEYLTIDEGYTLNNDGTTYTNSKVVTRRKL